MPRSFLLFLRVMDASATDYDRLVVRLHNTDKPRKIRWGDYMGISADKKHWITAKVEPSGATGKGKIYMNTHLRGLLNREAVGVPTARLGMSYPLHVRRAPSWQEALYLMRYHPDDTVRAKMRLQVYVAAIVATVGILVALLVLFLLLDLAGAWR